MEFSAPRSTNEDRVQAILADPQGYFAAARQRAQRKVRTQMSAEDRASRTSLSVAVRRLLGTR